jgi:hypothetical protein
MMLASRMLLDTRSLSPGRHRLARARRGNAQPDRLLPIWDIAVATEGRAGMNVKTYAEYIDEPLLKTAVEMDA